MPGPWKPTEEHCLFTLCLAALGFARPDTVLQLTGFYPKDGKDNGSTDKPSTKGHIRETTPRRVGELELEHLPSVCRVGGQSEGGEMGRGAAPFCSPHSCFLP